MGERWEDNDLILPGYCGRYMSHRTIHVTISGRFANVPGSRRSVAQHETCRSEFP